MKLKILAVCLILLFQNALLAQQPASELSLNQPINAELAPENSTQFSVQLLASQTARIEIEYQGNDISALAYEPGGKLLVSVVSPSGAIGRRTLLLPSETAGIYKIEVKRTQPVPVPIKFKIELAEVRKTEENDRLINKTRTRIDKLLVGLGGNPALTTTIAEHRDAIARRKQVIELSRVIDDKYREAESLLFIGSRYQSMGDSQPALDAWKKALEIYRELKRPDFEWRPVVFIGIMYVSIYESDLAIEYITIAEKLLAPYKSAGFTATIQGAFASAYSQKGEYGKALENAKGALAAYSALKLKSGEMIMHGFLGAIYRETGQSQLAIENFEKALRISEELPQAQGAADLQIKLGSLYWDAGKVKEASELFSKGNALATKVGQKHLVVESLYHLAVVENAKGNWDAAIVNLEKGIELVESIRGGLSDKSQRSSYFSTVQNTYDFYTDLLITRSKKDKNQKDIELAFEVSERSRARSLIDLLGEARIDFTQTVDSKLLDQQKDLSNQLDAALQSQKNLADSDAPQDEIDRVNNLVAKLTKDSELLAARIERESPRYSNLTRGAALSTNEIQKLLDSGTVLLEYKLGRERSFVWLVSDKSIKYFELPKREDLEKQVREFYELTVANQNTDAPKIQKLSKDLNAVLFSQFSKEIKGKRVAIVAEGILQYLPFSALQDESSTYFADRNEIISLPSASVLAELRLARKNEHKQILAVYADPVFDKEDSRLSKEKVASKDETRSSLANRLRDFQIGETLPRLLASRQEAKNITAFADQKKTTVKTDFEANVRDIQNSDLNNYQIIHFATHGLLNTVKPELSGLVFSLYDEAGNPQNGFLDLNDIYNLKLSSDMVVLSACQTGLGKDVRGEGLIGLSRGFLYAGSKRVVASLWKVDDSATAEFMKLFYKNHLQKGLPASSALRAAQLELKKIPRYRSPYYWSAFTILGDWR